MSKTTHPHIEGSSPQEEPYYLSCKRIDPKPIIEYGYVSYACDNSGFLRHLKGRDDEGMGSYGKHALERTPACSHCTDKDRIIAHLKRDNAQLARIADALYAEKKTTPSG